MPPSMDPSAGADMNSGWCEKKMLTMNVSCYSATKKVANGCCIKSPRLDAGGRSWRIIYYPKGMRPGTTESISLYLQLDDDDSGSEDVEVRYQFMLPAQESSIRFMSSQVVATFNRQDKNAHGFERFVTRDELEKSDCIWNDSFMIQCVVSVFIK